MIAFEVPDMTCGHCASAISKAVAGVDPAAQVKVDLAARRVEIEPGRADATAYRQALQSAISDAGFTPAAAAA